MGRIASLGRDLRNVRDPEDLRNGLDLMILSLEVESWSSEGPQLGDLGTASVEGTELPEVAASGFPYDSSTATALTVESACKTDLAHIDKGADEPVGAVGESGADETVEVVAESGNMV
jgi:hypothetical protein